jgi:co-chaperonin GroES (HSP10)
VRPDDVVIWPLDAGSNIQLEGTDLVLMRETDLLAVVPART